ncbi:MAG: hypothetical protein NC388_01355 [Clostridium sp.]|nr:hypothetical protein [Clostridium sp.]
MKRLLMAAVSCMFMLSVYAQREYNISSVGQGKSGHYLVRVTTVVSKSELKGGKASDVLKQCAVHGVIFRGLMAADGHGEQKPLVKDPNVEQIKADFFKAFNDEGAYKRYASLVEASLTSAKMKKGYEVTANLLVNKESLVKYLEESGVVKGFSNLW